MSNILLTDSEYLLVLQELFDPALWSEGRSSDDREVNEDPLNAIRTSNTIMRHGSCN